MGAGGSGAEKSGWAEMDGRAGTAAPKWDSFTILTFSVAHTLPRNFNLSLVLS